MCSPDVVAMLPFGQKAEPRMPSGLELLNFLNNQHLRHGRHGYKPQGKMDSLPDALLDPLKH